MKNWMFVTCLSLAVASSGCNDDESTKPTAETTAPGGTAKDDDHGHDHADDHDHDHAKPDAAAGEEHEKHPIGEKTVGGLKLNAAIDVPVKPGGESVFTVVVTGGKPKAVRFWIGNEAGDNSVKSKAEEESPDNWHAHVEAPDPLPAGSQFWVEVEPSAGETIKTSFDTKFEK